RAYRNRLRDQIDRCVRPLPEIPCKTLREQKARIAGRQKRRHDRGPHQPRERAVEAEEARGDPAGREKSLRGEKIGSPNHPGSPIWSDENVVEALRSLEV